ncbi:hypothetical protein [Hymenobacter sp. AT01-02]|uniref:hypothetical protein n=1 Tax=Hymenobacter sp. AT01-02 TaxID=1571877 RepID=UPI0005F1AD2A|nr:hypothetical protein [Hymenobacter sp. AT01-02]
MKKILLLIMLMASFQAFAQKKTQPKKAQAKPRTELIYDVDAVKNLANGEIDHSPCRVVKRGNNIIWTSPDNTLIFTITKTEWKGKEHVEYTANQGTVNASWIFRTVQGEKQIAFFTHMEDDNNVAMQMRVVEVRSRPY